MRITVIKALFLLVSISLLNTGIAHVSNLPIDSPEYHFQEPHKVVQQFNAAVAKGGLFIFDKQFDSTMLRPLRVEYVYELSNSIPKVKVYAELITPMPVPGQTGCPAIYRARNNTI